MLAHCSRQKTELSDQTLKYRADEARLTAIQRERAEIEGKIGDVLASKDQLLGALEYQANKHDTSMDSMRDGRIKLITQAHLQQRILASQVMLRAADRLRFSRLRDAYRELELYWHFDKRCNRRLTALSKVLEKCGYYLKREALNKWLRGVLKPYQTIT